MAWHSCCGETGQLCWHGNLRLGASRDQDFLSAVADEEWEGGDKMVTYSSDDEIIVDEDIWGTPVLTAEDFK